MSSAPDPDDLEQLLVEAPLRLQGFPEKLAVVRLPTGAEVPGWAESSSLFSVTASATETSLVCAGRSVPTKVAAHRGYLGFAVEGVLDADRADVLVAVLQPLAEARLGVLTLSTYDTEWFLVPALDVDRAVDAWRARGHEVVDAVPVVPGRKSS